jgi:superkiller protein 3
MSPDAAFAALTGPMAVELATAIDWWVVSRMCLASYDPPEPPDPEATTRLQNAAASLDPDPWRNQLRAAYGQKKDLYRRTLLQLRTEADLPSLPVASLDLLGSALGYVGAIDDARAVREIACEHHPADFGLIFALGGLQEARRAWQEAVACYRIARALRPQSREAQHRLGVALGRLGDPTAEERIFRELAQQDPANGHWQMHLGVALHALGREDEAAACHRRAIALGEETASTLTHLAATLMDQGQLDEATTCLLRAIDLDPKLASPHDHLGVIRLGQGRVDDAITHFELAIAFEPEVASQHANLGLALTAQGNPEQAIACFQRALQLDAEYATSHSGLGDALVKLGRLDEATASYRRAVALDPRHVVARGNLATALASQGQLDEAITHWHRLLELDPGNASGHYSLGRALALQDQPVAALDHLRRAAAIWSQHHDAVAPDQLAWVTAAIAELAPRIDGAEQWLALARGERDSASVDEFLVAAVLVHLRGEYVSAARTYARAFAAFPALLEAWPHRHNAACAAALAGGGKGTDARALTDGERVALREQARAWLAGDIACRRQALLAGGAGAADARQRLAQAQRDPSFDAVRGDEALARLPAAEAEAWRELWRQVAALLAKEGEGK